MKRDTKGRFVSEKPVSIKGYKGFLPDLTCRPRAGVVKQYAEGKYSIEERPLQVCHSGIHFSLNPLDVLAYYAPGSSVYGYVTAKGRVVKDSDKCCTSILYLDHVMSTEEFISHAVTYVCGNQKETLITKSSFCSANKAMVGDVGGQVLVATEECKRLRMTGRDAAAITTGMYSIGTVSGLFSLAAALDHRSISCAYENYSVACTICERSIARTSGAGSIACCIGTDSIALASSSYSIAACANGGLVKCNRDCSIAALIGYGTAYASGDGSVAVVTYDATGHAHCRAVAASAGAIAFMASPHGRVKGVIGSILCAAVYRYIDSPISSCMNVITAVVDGVKIKEDTWYEATKRGFIEATDDRPVED